MRAGSQSLSNFGALTFWYLPLPQATTSEVMHVAGDFRMKIFDPERRDLMRSGGIGFAALTAPLASFGATAQRSNLNAASFHGVFDVRAFGATGDGKALDTAAVNRTIDASVAAGGGVVIFPAGTYMWLSIDLRSQVYPHFFQGSTIIASDSPPPSEQTGYRSGAYGAAEPKTSWDAYQDYGHEHLYNSMFCTARCNGFEKRLQPRGCRYHLHKR